MFGQNLVRFAFFTLNNRSKETKSQAKANKMSESS